MIYNSFNFLILFPFLFLLYYLIPAKFLRVRNLFLLGASYLLYMSWKPIYALILLGVTLITFAFAILVERSHKSKPVMVWGVILSLLPLVFFKYFDFLNENMTHALSMMGICYHLEGLNWAIPIGISFFTFQALGYLWDVYYNKIEAERDFLTYALFIAFFPSILSGPINKASLVIPQLKTLRSYFDYHKAVEGCKMLLWGMFMKVVVADRVALYVDTILPEYIHYTGMSCLVASILYTIQIYTDFAGYSLMAIGVGKVLGFELTENFRRPYWAHSVTDFWHRWHISLSTWLKDYIYIPMGGSRCGKVRNYWNIFVTFLVSGIWHGANWTFVVWGVLHGVFQIVEKASGQQKCNYGLWGKVVKIFITFLLVNFAWIFFRMPTIADSIGVIKQIFDLSLPLTVEEFTQEYMVFMGIGIFFLVLKDFSDEFMPSKMSLLNNRYAIVRWLSYFIVIVMILLTGVFGSDQFIYANF